MKDVVYMLYYCDFSFSAYLPINIISAEADVDLAEQKQVYRLASFTSGFSTTRL